MAFVAPDIMVTRVLKQINLDLDISKLNGIGETELGIWKTEEGTPFIDGAALYAFPCLFSY